MKKQGNVTHNEDKNQSIDINPQITEIMVLAKKYIKIANIHMFQVLKHIKEIMNTKKKEVEDCKTPK